MIRSLVGEIWMDVVGFEGLYKVSNRGRIISCAKFWYIGEYYNQRISKKETLLKQALTYDRQGREEYLKVTLCKDGKKYTAKVHRVEAMAFIPNPKKKKFINHKDGNKQSNNLKNLEWCTVKENAVHASENGLLINPPRGEKNGHAKLTKQQVLLIRKIRDERGLSYAKIAPMFNVRWDHIRDIIKRRRWAHVPKVTVNAHSSLK